MNHAEIGEILADGDQFAEDVFGVLREIARIVAEAEEDQNPDGVQLSRQLVIRCLEHRDRMGSAKVVHDALLARIGLFPYLDDLSSLGLGDRLALEAHRPIVQPRDEFVFHSMQAQVYARLMDGETVILTAPTSFGKTLIVDALVVSGKYDNIAIVVPTIALIDEVRRRLSRLNNDFNLGFKVITHPSQDQRERNIFVLTQERVLEEDNFPSLGIVVIDEMYKLSLEQDPERGPTLNEALYQLRRLTKQLYLLGPNVGALSEMPGDFEHHFIPSNDSTVAVDVTLVERTDSEHDDLIDVCRGLTEPTLIFVKSPGRANEVVRWLVEADLGAVGQDDAAAWLADNYHPDWVLVNSLKAGIGLHHGRLPRAVAHYIVAAFNDEKLRFLVCTSTLIEGVNTTAKNIVVLDDRIAKRKYDLFTFKNIQGRSGRMFKHFIGRVFLFNPPPQDKLPDIDIPAISQPPDTPPGLLLSMDESDLTAESRNRVSPYLEQELLPVEVLRQNAMVDLDAQLELAAVLEGDPARWSGSLAWTQFPKYEELEAVSEILYDFFAPAARQWGAYSAKQLTLLVWRSYQGGRPKTLIEQQLGYAQKQGTPIDDVVLSVLTFQRNGLLFGFPRYLRVVDDIQRVVLPRRGFPHGDYRLFAAAAESGFLPNPLAALDEYGLPLEVSRKLSAVLVPRNADDSLDAVVGRLRSLSTDQPALEAFEIELLREAKADL